MTLDEAMAKVTRELDAKVADVLDGSYERMVSHGLDVEVIETLLRQQRAELVTWRRETLDTIREQLQAELFGDSQ